MTEEVVDLAAAREARIVAGMEALIEAARNASTDAEALAIAKQLHTVARSLRTQAWEPYVWQHPHRHPPGWVSARNHRPDPDGVCDLGCAVLPRVEPVTHAAWLQLGGRGTGKTEGAAHYFDAHAQGPACDPRAPGGHRFTIVGPTQADAVTACITGISGVQMVNPGVDITSGREGTIARWPSGVAARVVGANTEKDIDRLRAWSNICCAWVEEAAAMRFLDQVLEQLPYTLRLGASAHMVISTTPKPRPEIKALLADPKTVRTKGRTRDAHRLPEPVRAALSEKFGGTTRGRQELDADILDAVEGALWVPSRPALVDGAPNPDDRPGLDNTRVDPSTVGWLSHTDTPSVLPPDGAEVVCTQVMVGVDPPGGQTEAGIVVHGVHNRHGYTLADLSVAAGPDMWGRTAVQAYLDYGASGIVIEKTYGGDMTVHVIETAADAMDVPCPPIFKAPTKVGKKLRAEPVVALAQQGRLSHVGHFPDLETEQTAWVEDETKESPNRLDAYVHVVTHQMIRARPATAEKPTRGRRMNTTSGAGARTGARTIRRG